MKPIREYLKQIRESADPQKTLMEHAYEGLSEAEKATLSNKDVKMYTGKVRELVHQGDRLFIYHSDRLSAFDRYVGHVPYKGSILAKISEHWLRLAEEILPTHLVSAPHERVLETERLEPIKAEMIVRGYLAGSMMRAYNKGERDFCGVKLTEGLKDYGPLPELLITPTTKAEAYEHDENVTPKELIECGVVTEKEWQQLSEMSLALFRKGQEVYGNKGWILVDTKYEFGRTASGEIKVIDEVHTPDSSRLWVKETYDAKLAAGEAPEMLDKEIVRRYLMSKGFSGEGDVPEVPAENLIALAEVYLSVAESLIGEPMLSEGPLTTSPCLDRF